MREHLKTLYRNALRAQGLYGGLLFAAYFAALSQDGTGPQTLGMALFVVIVAFGIAPVLAFKALTPAMIRRPRYMGHLPVVLILHSAMALAMLMIATHVARSYGMTYLAFIPVSPLLVLIATAQWMALGVAGSVLSVMPSSDRSYATYYDVAEHQMHGWDETHAR